MSLIEEIAVQRIIEIHPKQVAVTLNLIGGTTQTYESSYGYPEDTYSGIDSGGAAHQSAIIVLHQNGETYAPNVDDWITRADGTTKWNIDRINVALNFETGVATHTCTCTRKA